MKTFAEWLLLGLMAWLLAACGGGGDGRSPTPAPSAVIPGTNTVTVTVAGGPTDNINLPMVSITVCVPSTNTCQVIDDVLVDTGSSGVRIFASALAPSMNLPPQALAGGSTLAECTPFADGNTWGPVRIADLRIAGEAANSIPIQVIGDPQFSTIPPDCVASADMLNTPQLFGANGVLGVGVFRADCGPVCALGISHGVYYACATGNCTPTAAPLERQVQNPVSFFAVNNNGVALTLPDVPPDGAQAAVGTLAFGIGTQANNALRGATVFTVDPDTGFFSTIYQGQLLSRSFIDSGSNGLFFNDPGIQVCPSGFYCPPATLALSAINIGRNGAQSSITFFVTNAEAVIDNNPGHRAFNHVAGTISTSDAFDWGLPFFFGRTVFTALEDAPTPGGRGPYFAY